MLRQRTIIGPALAIAGTVTGAFILYYALAHCTRLERDRLLVCAILIAFTIGFWSFYEQMGSSLNLFADRFVNRVVLGREIPAATLQALPSIYVILLAPLFSDLWVRLGEQEREPSTGVKFTLAIASCGAAFLVLAAAAQLAPSSGRVPLVFFAVNFLLLVTGELCLAPVGMSMVSRLAPTRIGGFMMGVFLLAYSASSYIAGLIAQLTSADTINGVLVDRATALARYAVIYGRLGVLALALALLLLVISPVLRRYARERDMVPAGAPQVATA
jgi:POT family proton-dependent oligopeptide transporter